YRIRKLDRLAYTPNVNRKPGEEDRLSKIPKGLNNTVVTPWSWPCVLVFVRQWESRHSLRSKPDQFIPTTLYLPDGRMVPTCVIDAPLDMAPDPLLNEDTLPIPNLYIGGGYPVMTDVQGRTRVASVGCLVTDGDLIYAITNQHVTG